MTATNLPDAQAFLAFLNPDADIWTFQTFGEGRATPPTLPATRHGTLDQCAGWLEEQNARGAGVFVTINETDGQGRKTANVTRVRALFADFDNPPPGTLARLKGDTMPPTLIVESSAGKYHAYWAVDGDMPLEHFKPLQRAIAQHWGSDAAVCDLSRVMRLPGFQHLKGEPQPVRLIECDGHRYSPEQLASRYPVAASVPSEHLQAPAAVPCHTPTPYGSAALGRACATLAATPEGGRNHALNSAAHGIAQLVAGGEIPEKLARERLTAAAEQSGLEAGEIEQTLSSAWKAGIKSPRTAPDSRALALAAFAGGSERAPTQERALAEVPLGDVMSATLEPVRFAVKPWMPRRHVTLFGGHGGIGKSSLALAIGAHVAAGRLFAGQEVERLSVLFVSLEDEASIVRLRLRRIIEAYGLPAAGVLDGLRLLDGTRSFAALMTEGDGFNAAPQFTPAFSELAEQAQGAGLIVIDNASDAFDANENSRRAVRAFVRALAGIARTHDAAVVLLAHIDKAAAKEGARGNSYSGSTAWHNSARSRLALLEKDGRILLEQEKANLSIRAEPVPFTFVDGVPVPEAGAQAAGGNAEDFDRAEIIRALRAATEAGINVPANLSPGAHSAMKALEPLPEYSQTFRGKTGGLRAACAVTALLRTGAIRKVEYRTPQRKTRERLELAEPPGNFV